jgi:heat-inducible transcriptional repressor
MSGGVLEQLELVRVASNRVMVILTVHSGLVKSIILQLRTEIRPDHLEHISRFLNDRLTGLTLREIRESMNERIQDIDPGDRELIRLFVESSSRLFDERPDSGTLSIEGIHSVTQQPEFGDPESIRNIIALAENHNVIVHMLDSLSGEQSLTIRIGKEIANDTLQSYSIIRAPYRIGELSGSVSLVGPKRMNYPRMIAIVEYLSKIMSS